MEMTTRILSSLVFLIAVLSFHASQANACVIISEVYPNPDQHVNEWIEITSECASPTNLSTFVLTDNVSSHYYPLRGILEPGAFAVAANDASAFVVCFNSSPAVIDLEVAVSWLNNGGDEVYLLDGGDVADGVEYATTGRNMSWSRCGTKWVLTPNATPGSQNDCPDDEEPEGSIEVGSIAATPSEASYCDPINFTFTVNSTMGENASIQSYVDIDGIGEFPCGEYVLSPMGEALVTCGWRVPCDLRTDGAEAYEACPSVTHNGTPVQGACAGLILEGARGFGEAQLTARDPLSAARFGEYAVVEAALYTGNSDSALRVVAYLYSPGWASRDLRGKTVNSHFNDTDTAVVLSQRRMGENLTLLIPVLLKDDCEREYGYGTYKGRIRVYEDVTGKEIADAKFNLTIEGRNTAQCKECEDCSKSGMEKCNCGTSVSPTGNNDAESLKNSLIEIVNRTVRVAAGSAFTTEVLLTNSLGRREEFSVYSYAFNSSRCVSLGKENGTWKGTWTANTVTADLVPGESREITLENMIDESVLPGTYAFRIRIAYASSKKDVTFEINVTEHTEEPHEQRPYDEFSLNGTFGMEEEPEAYEGSEATLRTEGMAASAPADIGTVLSAAYENLTRWLLSIFKF